MAHTDSDAPNRPIITFPDKDDVFYQVGDVSYFTPTHAAVAYAHLGDLAASLIPDQSQQPFPVTVLRVTGSSDPLRPERLVQHLEDALRTDDVLNEAWTHTMFLTLDTSQHSREEVRIDCAEIQALLHRFPHSRIGVEALIAVEPTIDVFAERLRRVEFDRGSVFTMSLDGPYLASASGENIQLFPVYRLYPDTQRAFISGMYKPVQQPSEDGAFYKQFRKVDSDGNLLIPVPSRLYGGPTSEAEPFGGHRIAVKDLFDVKGVVTGAGSKAYAALHGPAGATGSALRCLETLGINFVGLRKAVEDPFSARGDGWQSVNGSSTGSACAMTAYSWLDAAVGSDTAGSVRSPAAFAGLYGNRPSAGLIPLDGVIECSAWADTAGVLTRDPKLFASLLRAWNEGFQSVLPSHTASPKHLWIPSKWLDKQTPSARAVVDTFLGKVASQLNMHISDYPVEDKLADLGWKDDLAQNPILTALRKTVRDNGWIATGRDFITEHRRLHDGRDHLLDPWVKERWTEAEDQESRLENAYPENMRTLQAFKKAFNRDILPSNDTTGSEGILVYDIGSKGRPVYREPALNEGVTPAYAPGSDSQLASVAGFVDFTIPIGQVSYASKMTGVEEQKAVTVSLCASIGSDSMLMDSVDELHKAGIVHEVKTGRTPF